MGKKINEAGSIIKEKNKIKTIPSVGTCTGIQLESKVRESEENRSAPTGV